MGRFLVTGCAGFIGSHLCDRLIDEGHKVVGIDNFDSFYNRSIKNDNLSRAIKSPKFSLIEGDIANEKTWQSFNDKSFDAIYHLAAKAGVRPSISDPAAYIRANIIGTQKLLEWMVTSGNKKLVFASSSSVYGNNKNIPFSENDKVDHPISPYAFTKKSCELMIHTYSHLYDLNTTCLRFFTVYGPRQRPDLAINKFFKAIINNEPITLYGDGSSSRDYTYIDDIIDGVLNASKALNNQSYSIINIGGEHPVKLSNLVSSIEKVIGEKAKINYIENQPGDVSRTFADISVAKNRLNYYPRTNLEEGLKIFYTWFKEKEDENNFS